MSGIKSIIGYEYIKKELTKVADVISNYDRYEKLGVDFPNGILFDGVPGVGKTLMAMSLIEDCKINSYTIVRKDKDGADFLKSIKDAFEYAKNNQPAIILFDDMDKFENGDRDHVDGESYVAVQSGIDEIKNDKVFIIGTTNDKHKLPRSLVRSGRFDKVIDVEPPRGKDAEEIIKFYLKKKKTVTDIDCKELANILSGHSCADLEKLINEAGISAGYRHKKKIDMDDMIEACLELDFNGLSSIEDRVETTDKTSVAIHEAGHAVIGEILNPNSITLVSIGAYESDIGGITSYVQPENYWSDIENMEHRVIELLGGAAAYYLHYNKVDTGCGSDFSRAYQIVNRFHEHYCLSGFEKYKAPFEEVSPETLRDTEKAIGKDLDKYFNDAKRILSNNKEFVDKLTNALLEKKTLRSKDVQEIKSQCKIVL